MCWLDAEVRAQFIRPNWPSEVIPALCSVMVRWPVLAREHINKDRLRERREVG